MRTIPLWLRGGVMLAATALAWGGMFPIMKPLLAQVDPVTLTLVRFGLSAPILVALLLFVEGVGALAFQGKTLRLWWLGTLGFAGFGLMLVLGLDKTRPEHAAVMPALMPLISIIIVSMRRRARPASRALAAIAAGIAGVILVVTGGHPEILLHGGAGRGELLVLLGAICWVLYTLGAAEFQDWSGLRYTTLTLSLGTLSIAIIELAVLATGTIQLPTMSSLVKAAPAFGYLVLAASVMGFLCWNAGMRALGPARGVLFINLVPVTAFVIAFVGGQVPTWWEAAGVILVIGALVYNSLSASRK